MKTTGIAFLAGSLCILMSIGSAPLAFSQSALDGFDPNANNNVLAAVVQPDGKIVVGGQFTTVAGVARGLLARLNTDGSLDTAFNPSASGGLSAVSALALQTDGRILVGGDFTTLAGQSVTNLGRLNADGTLDVTFNSSANASVRSIIAQADGRLLVAGRFTTLSGASCNYLGRLSTKGTLDATFNPSADGPVNSLGVDMDGKIAVGGEFTAIGVQPRLRLARLNGDGTLDLLFNPGADGVVEALAIQADGKWVVGGEFNNLAAQPRSRIGRLNPDGGIDAAFDPGANDTVLALVMQPDGKILVAGSFISLGAASRNRLGRLNPDGTLDTLFNPGANASVNSLFVQPDGKILALGQFISLGGQTRHRIGRLYPNGSLDATFNPGANGAVISLVPQADGRVFAGGEFTILNGQLRTNIGRLNPDGSLDPAFNAGPSDTNAVIVCQLPDIDGKILVAGQFTHLGGQSRANLGRLNADGSLDDSFLASAGDTNSFVYTLARQANGDILVGGQFTNLAGRACLNLGRLHPNGSADKFFNPGPAYLVTCVAVQDDGKILVGGVFDRIAGQSRTNIARLNADGTLDTTFSHNAGVGDLTGNSLVYCLAVQADGKILVGGVFNAINGQSRTNLGRLNADGSLDSTFNPRAGSGYVVTVVPQTDGKILLAGQFTTLGGKPRANLGRLNADGSLDAFNPGAGDTNSLVYSVAPQVDGKILVGGAFTTLGGQTRVLLGRLTSGGAASQSLGLAPGGTGVVWNRAGTGPEVGQVSFEQSSDGLTYNALGSGTRANGGWVLNGLTFPRDQNYYVRARGFTVGGFTDGSGGIIESVRQFYIANHPPVARCNNVTAFADDNCTANASIDNGSFDPDLGDTVTVVQSPLGPYPVGNTLVTLTVTDNYGASASCTGMVTVLDPIPPTITCPSNIVLSAGARLCAIHVPFSVTAAAHCGTARVECNPPSGSSFPQGTTAVSCQALDSSSNAVFCSFTVTVIDTDPPELVYPLDTVVTAAPGSCAKTVIFGVGARDNCGPVSIVCMPPAGSSFPVGINKVTCIAVDGAGNTSTNSFPVTVVDLEVPVLNCPNVLLTNTAPGQCGAIVSFSVTAIDNCAGAVAIVCAPPSGATFAVGTNTVVCTATDPGSNRSQCSFPVVVMDREPPSITCPGDLQIEFTDETGAVATFSAAASDNCYVRPAACFPPSGSVFPIGVTPVRCIASDDSRLSAACSFSVSILGPRDLVEKVLADLIDLRSTVTNRDDGNSLDDSIRHLTTSLDSTLWLDHTHLQPRHGEGVFNEDKWTVHDLNGLLNNGKSLLDDDLLQSFIDRITRADRLLAVIEIHESAAALNPKKIAEDTLELAKGDDAISNGKYDEGLDHYKNAWLHALHLSVKATPKADGGVHLEFLTLTAGPYQIQSSTNLVNWVTVGSATSNPQGLVVFDDPPAATAPRRFYRVLSP